MKIIYVAGPYRAKTEWQVLQNVRMAETVALNVWTNGGVAICPHKNTERFGGAAGLDDNDWIKGDLEIIKRCDAMIVCPHWKESEGTKAEIKLAKKLNIPIFFWEYYEYNENFNIEKTWGAFLKFLKS
jgi:hypothetical protein